MRGILFLSWLLWCLEVSYSAECSGISSQSTCEGTNGCMWESSHCTCAANVTLDVFFALDASGSIGSSDFQVELQWVQGILDSALPQTSRVGTDRFATTSSILMTLQQSEAYTLQQLESWAATISYTGGSTNTVAALEDVMAQFSAQGNPYASWVLILITDGNPSGNFDTNVCARASRLKSMGITTIIIGVGQYWDKTQVDCLVTDDSYIIHVSSYSASAINAILPTVTSVTCPVEYKFKTTEVQMETESGSEGSRFVEIYNTGDTIPLNKISMSGIFTGTISSSSSDTWKQNTYLVLYDGDAPDLPSCQDCGCSQSSNMCTDAKYVQCCSSGCPCYYTGGSNGYSNGYWSMVFKDEDTDDTIESVTYDATWPSIIKGYSYELKYVGYNNQQGSNWQQSCNIRGTPGDGPISNCTWTCDTNTYCQQNGDTSGQCSPNGKRCNCGDKYYFSDQTCKKIPPPGDCYAYWQKNDTNQQRWVKFVWEKAQTDNDKNYSLAYYVTQSNTDKIETSSRSKKVIDYYYDRGPDVAAGNVRTVIDGHSSDSVACTPVTYAPTSAPSDPPTRQPTAMPSMAPTPAPTYEPPHIWISGDICQEDRCGCAEESFDTCNDNHTKIYKNFAASDDKQFITVRKFPGDYPYYVHVRWSIELLDENYHYNPNAGRGNNDDDDDDTQEMMQLFRGSRKLLATTTDMPWEMSTTDGSDIDIHPRRGELLFNGTLDEKIAIMIPKLTDYDSKYRLYRCNLTICEVLNHDHICTLSYPSQLYMIVDVTGGSNFSETKSEKEMPEWLWYVIGGLILFLFLLGWLVYKYWWKNKKTTADLMETENDLDMALEENELGFAHDLGAGDVTFNPIATGVPGTQKAPQLPSGVVPDDGFHAQHERADVAVEKFHERTEIAGNHGRKPNFGRGGNNLAEPLLGDDN